MFSKDLNNGFNNSDSDLENNNKEEKNKKEEYDDDIENDKVIREYQKKIEERRKQIEERKRKIQQYDFESEEKRKSRENTLRNSVFRNKVIEYENRQAEPKNSTVEVVKRSETINKVDIVNNAGKINKEDSISKSEPVSNIETINNVEINNKVQSKYASSVSEVDKAKHKFLLEQEKEHLEKSNEEFKEDIKKKSDIIENNIDEHKEIVDKNIKENINIGKNNNINELFDNKPKEFDFHIDDKKSKKKKFKPLKYFFRIAYVGAFIGITSPIVLLYGPYKETRSTFLSTLLATRHAYLLTDNFSEATLNKFMGLDESSENQKSTEQNINEIQVAQTSGTEIQRYNIKTERYDAYILEIKNPLSIKVAMTKYLGQYGQTTSEMAEDHDALAAINGGSFIDQSVDGVAYSGTGGLPGGFVISDGEVIYPQSNVDKTQVENVIAFTETGTLIVGDHSIEDLEALNVKEAMTFRRPNILINGEKQDINVNDGINPRTVVGQKKDGTVIFLVVDGRKVTKPGATLQDVQQIMLDRGAWNAGALDGGYSSTMYYKGEVINSPNSWNGERKVATTFYVEK